MPNRTGNLPQRSVAARPSSVDDEHAYGAALVLAKDTGQSVARYVPPVPGQTWRSFGRFCVLLGGSALIGVGVASGGVTLAAAAVMAMGLATAQVMAQTHRQNRLGQSVVGGIALGDLDAAEQAASQALVESPSGVMRTLAASNLASVLIQTDRVHEALVLLDRYPPGLFSMPLATILWLNNRAFAALALGDKEKMAAGLIADAERRLERAHARDLGGVDNQKKLRSALLGTRAIACVQAGDGKAALAALRQARATDEAPATPYRTVERELCRAQAHVLLSDKDEAILALSALTSVPMTRDQKRRYRQAMVDVGLVAGDEPPVEMADPVSDG